MPIPESFVGKIISVILRNGVKDPSKDFVRFLELLIVTVTIQTGSKIKTKVLIHYHNSFKEVNDLDMQNDNSNKNDV